MVDGHSIPHQTWNPKVPEEAAGIAMMIGNCKDESTLFSLQNQALFNLDDVGLRATLVKAVHRRTGSKQS